VVSEDIDWQITALIVGSVAILIIVIGLCFVKERKMKTASKRPIVAHNEEIASRGLTLNATLDED